MTKTNIWAMIEWLRAGLLLQALLDTASRATEEKRAEQTLDKS